MARPDCLYCLGRCSKRSSLPLAIPCASVGNIVFHGRLRPWRVGSPLVATSSYLAGSDHMEQRRHADIFFSSGPLSAGPCNCWPSCYFSLWLIFSARLRLYLLGHPPHGRFGRFRFRGSLGDLNFLSILLGCWIYVSRGSGGLPPHQPQYGSSGLCCLSAGCPLGRRHLRGSRPGSHRGRGSSSAASSCIRSPWQPA